MNQQRHLFTSESVTEGHPDKMADAISDSILDAILKKDPDAHVACETYVNIPIIPLPVMMGCGVQKVISVVKEFVEGQPGTAQRQEISVTTGYVMMFWISA